MSLQAASLLSSLDLPYAFHAISLCSLYSDGISIKLIFFLKNQISYLLHSLFKDCTPILLANSYDFYPPEIVRFRDSLFCV